MKRKIEDILFVILFITAASMAVYGGMGYNAVTARQAGDNLGNHVATTTLNMAGYGVYNTSSVTFGDGSVQYTANVPQVELDYYLSYNASDIAQYNLLYSTFTTDPQQTISATATSSGVIVSTFTTYATTNTIILGEGIYHCHFHANVSATAGQKLVRMYFVLYSRDPAGTEVTLSTSELSDQLTTTVSEYDIHAIVIASETFITSGSRIVMKMFQNITGGPGSPTINLYVEGTTASRIELASNITALDNRFVQRFGNSTIDGSIALSTTTNITPPSNGVSVYSNPTDLNGFYLYSQALGTILGQLANAGNASQLILNGVGGAATGGTGIMLTGSSTTAGQFIHQATLDISTVSRIGFIDGTVLTSTAGLGGGSGGGSNKETMEIINNGDIYASSATFAAIPESRRIFVTSATITGVFAFQETPSTVWPSEFNVCLSTYNNGSTRAITYLLGSAISLGTNISSSTPVSISSYVPAGTWVSVHVTTCATTGTLPSGWGIGLEYSQ